MSDVFEKIIHFILKVLIGAGVILYFPLKFTYKFLKAVLSNTYGRLVKYVGGILFIALLGYFLTFLNI